MEHSNDQRKYRALLDKLLLVGASGVFYIGASAAIEVRNRDISRLEALERHSTALERDLYALQLAFARYESKIDSIFERLTKIERRFER